ncbi:YbaB/EbfC family nucleoid-associated protein [Spongiactinospora sp. TRM90649]|uniref:YbaB/EbfC family nucleoid-associated protein n=1 Tax=Spongiactinospora sp. TRM90649 TaxID=3031114 RepID=UPI0023F6295D|nr:YbaB/EbfC family nucleoid-associated protein [Spongiactinospora sp. TRM90649]MDF5758947.1 YbaB/EbfC family nucleoid-associated protein [Spongiactinospora sp. TRM90649]
MSTPDEPFAPTGDPEIDQGLAGLVARMGRYEQVAHQINETRGRGEAAGGLVTVEVLPSGALAALRIAPRAMRLSSQALAEAILAAAAKAEEDAVEQTSALAESLLAEPDGPSR